MSEYANSCEYYNVDSLCSAVSESEKATSNRQARCLNEEKLACCYICSARRECPISCRYLGNSDGGAARVEAKGIEPEIPVDINKNMQTNQAETAAVAYCSSCNAEMAQTTTALNINGWKGPDPKAPGDVLPVTVYMCPQCGKIEFKANKHKQD